MATVVEPAPIPETTPKELPKTASPMGLIGLIGFLSVTGGYVTRFFRR
jgi:LPXTG-motif cell wall-anchored protein